MTLQQAIPGYTPADWAAAVLKGFGAPVNATNIDSLTRWANAESGGYNPNSGGGKYNPLNVVVQSNDKHTGQGGSQGNIADFGNLQDGVAATVRLFTHNKNAAGILDGLRSTNQQATFSGVQSFYGTWGGGISFGAAPSNSAVGDPGTSSGAAGGPTGTSSGTADSSAGGTEGGPADSDCVWKLTMPGPIPNLCVTHSQGRALLGVATMATGFALLIVAAGIASRRQIISGLGGIAGAAKVL